MKIMVIGAGTMGLGIARQAALRGFRVDIAVRSESSLRKARAAAGDHPAPLLQRGIITPREAEEAAGRMRFSTDQEGCAREADFIFEAAAEDIAVKRALFAQLGEWTRPDAILASNTSSFDINRLSEATKHPERVIGTHWFNPPQLTPCVEVIPAASTHEDVVRKSLALVEALGKYGTRCSNGPGFIGNRIQFAMLAEAFKIIDEGLATPAEVDRIVKSSFGFRLGAYGPCEIADQGGLDVFLAVFESLREGLKNEQYAPAGLLRTMVAEGRLGLKSGKGFYEYGEEGAKKLRRERDERYCDRLELFNRENVD